MSEWRSASLAEFFEIDNSKLGLHDSEPTVLSLSKYEGFVRADDYFDKRIASANLDGYKTVPAGGWAFSTIHIDEGSIALNLLEPGVISPMYTTMRWIGDGIALPSFLAHVVRQPFMLDEYKRRAQGTVNRRRSLPFKTFSAIEVPLPPVDEQRRIVTVLSAVDAQIKAVEEEVRTVIQVLIRIRLALLTVGLRGPWQIASPALDAADDWTKRLPAGWAAETISAVALIRSGATPKRSEQARYFDNGSIPWVKTGDLNEGVLGATDERITELALRESSVRVLPPDTILVAMYGGFGQIGRTARLGVPSTTNQALSALTELRSDVLPAFMHEVLKAGRPKWRRVAASSRKDPNITKADVEQFDFPRPPLDEQTEIVKILSSQDSAIDALRLELAALRIVRVDLLNVLLSQEITVDAAVDRFVKAA